MTKLPKNRVPVSIGIPFDLLQKLDEITIKEGIVTGSLPRRALRMIYDWLDTHQEELIANWERLENHQTPLKIDPLK